MSDAENISLRDYVERRFASVEVLWRECDRRYQDRFEQLRLAAEAATACSAAADAKADAATEKRFDSINEFRKLIQDLTGRLMPRTEAEAHAATLNEKFATLQTRVDRTEGSNSGMRQGWTVLVGAVALIATLVALFAAFSKPPPPDPRLSDLVERVNALTVRLNTVPTPSK